MILASLRASNIHQIDEFTHLLFLLNIMQLLRLYASNCFFRFTMTRIIKSSLSAVLLSWLSITSQVSIAETKDESNDLFQDYFYGKTPLLYRQKGEWRQDTSGGAWDGKQIIIAYDGGNDSYDTGVRIFPQFDSKESLEDSFKHGELLTRSVIQRDIEGATFINDSYFTTSSMSLIDEESPGYRLLVEFHLDKNKQNLTWERSVDLRRTLLEALKSECGDAAWFSRVKNVFGRRGGLNVEGLSFDPQNDNGLILGLRSPLCAQHFGSPDFDDKLSLRNGKAMLISLSQPFEAKPKFAVTQLDLQGHGIRGIEYIRSLRGYLIIGGPVAKENDYSLWFYQPNKKLIQVNVPGFSKLCRPETVIETTINQQNKVIIFSEEAGNACKNAQFTYIGATVKTDTEFP